MNEVITIGVDLAKNVFQVHGVDAEGAVVVRRKLRRRQVLAFFKKLPPCLVGMEACATSHYWAREIAAPSATFHGKSWFCLFSTFWGWYNNLSRRNIKR